MKGDDMPASGVASLRGAGHAREEAANSVDAATNYRIRAGGRAASGCRIAGRIQVLYLAGDNAGRTVRFPKSHRLGEEEPDFACKVGGFTGDYAFIEGLRAHGVVRLLMDYWNSQKRKRWISWHVFIAMCSV